MAISFSCVLAVKLGVSFCNVLKARNTPKVQHFLGFWAPAGRLCFVSLGWTTYIHTDAMYIYAVYTHWQFVYHPPPKSAPNLASQAAANVLPMTSTSHAPSNHGTARRAATRNVPPHRPRRPRLRRLRQLRPRRHRRRRSCPGVPELRRLRLRWRTLGVRTDVCFLDWT